MTDYTISCKLSNETVYAYYRGRFWHWNGSIWKESRIMTHRFELAKAADKKLTPPEFLSNDAEFAPLDEYEIDSAMLDALENAKPCKNAPIEPVKEDPTCKTAPNADAAAITAERAAPNATAETPTTSESAADASASAPAASPQTCASALCASVEDSSASPLSTASQDKPLAFIREDKCPAFDYSGLTDQTVEDLHFAEDEYRHGKQMAERGLVHMGNAIAAAHDALCGVVAQCDNGEDGARLTMRQARNNQHSEDTFKDWCLSVGVTKPTAYRLLQVSALMDGSTPRQRKILESLPPTLLYAVAKPSAPPELVEKVKNGEVSSNKAYQDLLKENQQLRTDRVNAMNQAEREKQRADAAVSEIGERDKTIKSLIDRSEEADARADNMESKYKAALADVQGLTEKNSHLQQSYEYANEAYKTADVQRQQAEARAKNAENQLSGSRQVAEAAKLRADKLKAENDALKKQPITAVVDEEEVDRRAGEKAYEIAAGMTADYKVQQEQDARDAYDSILMAGRSMLNTWQIAKPSLRKLPPEQREAAANQIIRTLGQIQGEVSTCL